MNPSRSHAPMLPYPRCASVLVALLTRQRHRPGIIGSACCRDRCPQATGPALDLVISTAPCGIGQGCGAVGLPVIDQHDHILALGIVWIRGHLRLPATIVPANTPLLAHACSPSGRSWAPKTLPQAGQKKRAVRLYSSIHTPNCVIVSPQCGHSGRVCFGSLKTSSYATLPPLRLVGVATPCA